MLKIVFLRIQIIIETTDVTEFSRFVDTLWYYFFEKINVNWISGEIITQKYIISYTYYVAIDEMTFTVQQLESCELEPVMICTTL